VRCQSDWRDRCLILSDKLLETKFTEHTTLLTQILARLPKTL